MTDRLFGLLGQAVDTVGQVQVARLTREVDPPAPTAQPRALATRDTDADTLRTAVPPAGPGLPWAWIAGGLAVVAVTVLVLRK